MDYISHNGVIKSLKFKPDSTLADIASVTHFTVYELINLIEQAALDTKDVEYTVTAKTK